MSGISSQYEITLPEEMYYGSDLEYDDEGIGYARVKNYPNYIVTTVGDVISFFRRTPRVLHQTPTNKGHLYVDISDGESSKRFLVHRLIADAFLPNPNNSPVVRHLNDDPQDNNLDNLRWGSFKDNREDMVRNGNDYRRGVYCFERDKHYRTCKEAADDLGVSKADVTICCQGKTSNIKGLHLCYEDDYEKKSSDTSWMTIKNNFKPIVAIDKDGNRTRYNSRKEAAEAIGIPSCGISSVVNGYLEKTHGWRFEEAHD